MYICISVQNTLGCKDKAMYADVRYTVVKDIFLYPVKHCIAMTSAMHFCSQTLSSRLTNDMNSYRVNNTVILITHNR